MGSSPLARGLLTRHFGVLSWHRIIPARAGFTGRRSRSRILCGDHPRSRGVYATAAFSPAVENGSSPLARGLQKLGDTPNRIFGIIPARAGFTSSRRIVIGALWDHPRSRGVYLVLPADDFIMLGSSPLARGLRLFCSPPLPPPRIIPARAGFTVASLSPIALARDHPRSRGVYPTMNLPSSTKLGSSPLARGLLDLGDGVIGRKRIIPARAGFTHCPRSWGYCCWDHPRSRGVYNENGDIPSVGQGSSPLARGLRG